MITHGFLQIINKPTRVTNKSTSLIDHIFTNNTAKISQAGVIELRPYRDPELIGPKVMGHALRHQQPMKRQLERLTWTRLKSQFNSNDLLKTPSSKQMNIYWQMNRVQMPAMTKEQSLRRRYSPTNISKIWRFRICWVEGEARTTSIWMTHSKKWSRIARSKNCSCTAYKLTDAN